VVYTYRLNFVIVSPLWGKKLPKYCNFNQIFTTARVAIVPSPFTDQGQIWHQTVDQWTMLWVYACTPNFIWLPLLSPPWTKNCNFGQHFKFGGLHPAPPSIRVKCGMLKYVHSPSLHAKFCLTRVILLHSGSKKTQIYYFLDFDILWRLQLAVHGESWM